MSEKKLLTAVEEAKRFLARVDDLTKHESPYSGIYCGSKRTAAVKRASMDLTRALSDLREW